LVLFKFGAWISNESLSLLSDLIDSLLYMWANRLQTCWPYATQWYPLIKTINLGTVLLNPLPGWHKRPSLAVRRYLFLSEGGALLVSA
jgi:hypothetical protein